MKLDFIGIGTQKAGTSTLHDILKQHSKILLPQSKEAHFFDSDIKFERGLNWFEKKFFSDYDETKITGKFTPEYLYYEEVPGRIYDTFGNNVKFIIILRHPVERAISHYNMTYRRGLEKLTFDEAVKEEATRIKQSSFNRLHYSYISRGFYAKQVQNYLNIFPKENFLFLSFEKNILKNIGDTIKNIQQFLNVEQQVLDYSIKSNEAYSVHSVRLNQLMRNNKKFTPLFDRMPALKKFKNIAIKKLLMFNRTKEKSYQFNMNETEKRNMFKRLYAEDTAMVQQLTGLNLENWKG